MTTRAITETTTGEHWVAARVQAVVETTTPKTTQGIVTTIHEGSSVIAARAIVTRASIRAHNTDNIRIARSNRVRRSGASIVRECSHGSRLPSLRSALPRP